MGLLNHCSNISIKPIFIKKENSKTNEAHQFFPNLSQRLDFRSSNKHVAFQNLCIYYDWEKNKITVQD